MGLFQHKTPKKSDDDASRDEEHFFDEYFREELRNRGRWYFEKIITENGSLFKKDLDATVDQIDLELKEHVTKQLDSAIAQLNAELREHVTKQIDQQFAEHSKTMQAAQDTALKAMTDSASALQAQHKQLSDNLEKHITDQNAILHNAYEESKAQVTTMKDSQRVALEWLKSSVQAMQDQYQQLGTVLQKNVADQQAMLMGAFEANMAAIIEHYLLGALGDQYDLKAQLPSIIKQMEANKQAIVDDMKL